MCLGQDAPPTARRCTDAQAHETTTVCMLAGAIRRRQCWIYPSDEYMMPRPLTALQYTTYPRHDTRYYTVSLMIACVP